MKIRHTLDISPCEKLMADFEGADELEIEVYVHITSWGRNDRGRAYIKDFEIEQIDIVRDGSRHYVEGLQEEQILELLDADSSFMVLVYEEAQEAAEDYLLDHAIASRESEADCIFASMRGN